METENARLAVAVVMCNTHVAYLQVRNMELEVGAQAVLLGGDVVHRLERLLASLVARRGYQPVFSHGAKLIYSRSGAIGNLQAEGNSH